MRTTEWRGLALALALLLAAPAFAQPQQQQQQQQQGGQAPLSPPALPAPRSPITSGIGLGALLPDINPLARTGAATEAEGGPVVIAPLGELDRTAGTPTAVFGATLFTRRAETPSETANPNYRIMPGDRVSITVWGSVEGQVQGVVDPDGNVFLPNVGPVRLAGTRAGDLQRVVEAEVRRVFTAQVQVYAVLIAPGRVGVFVTGFVRQPGRHLGAASDSVLDYLSRAGGPDPSRGSFRDIVVNRGNRTVARVDLYTFLLQGRLPDLTLQEGDTIVVGRQRSLVGADGAVRNNFLFEMPPGGRAMPGRELLNLSAPLPSATNVAIRGTRDGRPWSRYATMREVAALNLQDQDVISFITDAPAPTIRVTVEGSRIGPSVLVADRDISLCQLLDHVAVDPVLANPRAVFLLRPALAAQQRRAINESLDRLERQLFLAMSPTTGVAAIRASEANLVASYIQRGRRIQPEGRLVVTDPTGRCFDVRLVDGDTVVIPERSETVLVAGEVVAPQAVVWREGLRLADYVRAAGGYSPRGDGGDVMLRRANGEVLLATRELPRPGDELIVLPRLDPKTFQMASDLLNLIFQSAVVARVFD
jgi:protein involved in polysaccharide export with SLBB domain